MRLNKSMSGALVVVTLTYCGTTSARYIQGDPMGLEGGVNPYAYAIASPLRFADPTGLDVTVTMYPGGTGHVGIGINSPQTQGLYPQQKTLPMVLCRDVPGVVLNDQARQSPEAVRRSSSVVIKTSSTQDQLIQDFINQSRNSPNVTYNLCSQQCTRFVVDALSAGGVGLPRLDSVRPQDLFDVLREAHR